MSNQSIRPLSRAFPNGLVDSAFRASEATWLLEELRATPTDCYLVGGAVRDMILGANCPADLDLIVPNHETFVHGVLDRFGEGRRNRHGNWRYSFANGRHVDVIEPRNFYRQFRSPVEALAFFDTSVNSLGLRLRDGHLLDPRGGLQDLLAGQVSLDADRWTTMDEFESVHLTLRLLRLINKHPLRIVNPSLALAHIEKFRTVEWDQLHRLNGVTRVEACAAARSVLGSQISPSADPNARRSRRAITA
jgi:Poly A polymerase head domain